jgi:hypothetical protein
MTPSSELLAKVLRGVLEEAAFVFTEPGAPRAAAESVVIAEVRFRGPERGRLVLACPLALGVEIAESFTGCEPDSSVAEAWAADATAEIVNMLAGRLLVEWWGPEATYDLDLPRVRLAGRRELEPSAGEEVCRAVLATETDQRVDALVATVS